MRKFLTLIIGASLFLFLIGGAAHATLIGDDVDVSHSNAGGVFRSDTVTAGTGGPEWTFLSSNYYTVDLTADSVDVDFGGSDLLSGNSFLASGINDDSGQVIAGINIDTNVAGWTDDRASFGDDFVGFDLGGLDFAADSYLSAELVFGDVGDTGGGDTGGGDTGGNTMANPVPAPILLLGTGLVGLAGFRKRNRK